VPPAAPPEPELTEPPYYEATEDLHVYDPEAGTAPAVAFRAGDQVHPELVEANGWGGKVRVPEQFRDTLAPPAPPPEPDQDKDAAPAGDGGKE